MRPRTLVLALCLAAVGSAQDQPDLAIVHRIRAEAFQNSQVMDTLFYLTDVNGPRVTNSRGFKAAAAWAVKRLQEYGLTNVTEEPAGAFGRSWNCTHYAGHTLQPSPPSFGPGGPPSSANPNTPPPDPAAQRRFRERVAQFLHDEAPAAVVQYTTIADGGTVFGTSGGSYKFGELVPRPTVVLTPEHYNRVVRLLEHKIPVKLEFDIRAEFGPNPEESFNIVGEIEGGRKKDEVVMVGGHFDSWHGGTGATDNGTGSSVAIEAMRILKALDVKLDRTVRIALWSGRYGPASH